MKLRLSADGTELTGLYTDKFPFKALGTLCVERASNVIYDNSKGQWFVTAPKGGVAILDQGFDTRQEAIDAEIIHLEKELDNMNEVC